MRVAELNVRSVKAVTATPNDTEQSKDKDEAVAVEVDESKAMDDETILEASLVADESIANELLETVQVHLDNMDLDNENADNTVTEPTPSPPIEKENAGAAASTDTTAAPATISTTMTGEPERVVRHSPRILENAEREKVTSVHGSDWYKYENQDNIPLNGRTPKKKFGIRLSTGEILFQNGDYNKFIPHWIIF